MITYKFFRDKFFVLSDKPILERFGRIADDEQIHGKPNGLWFSKGLQWFNLVLNSHHGMYNKNNEESYANKTLYLHQVDLDWNQIRYINDETDALKLIYEMYKTKKKVITEQNMIENEKIWKRYVTLNPNMYGIYINLNNKYNLETRARRGNDYAKNTEQREWVNMKNMEKRVKRYFKTKMTHTEYKNRSNIDFALFSWYPVLSVSSGCIWDDRAINFEKSKLVLELPSSVLEMCKSSSNSIQALLKYINENNIIHENNNNIIPPLNNIFQNSSRTKKSSNLNRRHTIKMSFRS